MSTARIGTAAALIAVALLGSGCGATKKINDAAKAVDSAAKTVEACNNLTDVINKSIDSLNAANKAAKSDTDPVFLKKIGVEMTSLHSTLSAQAMKVDKDTVKTAIAGLDAQVTAWGAHPATYTSVGAANKFNALIGKVSAACGGK
jgi:hypothetical protein